MKSTLTTLEGLYEGEQEIDTSTGITSVNMKQNFDAIQKYLKENFDDDKRKFETFVFYFLHRLVLVRLEVTQTDVPMIFEVINDRGVELKPYEILKGKLLGQIDKSEVEKYNRIFVEQVEQINVLKQDDIDTFFRSYLRAKYANNMVYGRKFDGAYQREMFSNEMNPKLKLKRNIVGVKSFLEGPFTYYTNLYSELLKVNDDNKEYPCVFFNKLNRLNQFMLILSGVSLDDSEENG